MNAALERDLARLLAPGRAPQGLRDAWAHVGEFARRQGKRLRARLVRLGWAAGGGQGPLPRGVVRFGAGLELLHAFMLVHDDVADGADTRRGGPALHRLLGDGRLGEHLAVIAGDLLFVEAVDAMLACGMPGAARATREVLETCRDTAAGQYLDVAFTAAQPGEVLPQAARQAALLKTARYSFEAPLVAGALLASARPAVVRALREVARPLGLAFQLQDDLLPFRLGDAAGKPALADLTAGKKTWMLALAWQALDEVGRARLRRCLAQPEASELACVEQLLRGCGALCRVEREVQRLCALSHRAALRPSLAPVAAELCAVIDRVRSPDPSPAQARRAPPTRAPARRAAQP